MTAGRRTTKTGKTWNTPPHIVEAVRATFGVIDLDPCANEYSTVRARHEYRLPAQDGLKESWNYEHIYVNPPYGRDEKRKTSIRDWFARMAEASNDGAEVIALVPVATNTVHWKKHVFGVATCICFLYASQLRFYLNGVEDRKGAPMACAAIYYGKREDAFADAFVDFGAIVSLRQIRTPDEI